jgi:nucleoside-diphosphate-sugar epimerase
MQKKVAILGAAGAIGKGATPELLKQGLTVRVVGRSREKLARAFAGRSVEIQTADLTTIEGCRVALADVDTAVYAIGLPYTKKDFAQYSPMMHVCLEAARQVGLKKLILITNVYPYGLPQFETVTEDHPRIPCSVKGEYRKQQEDIALASHGKNGLSVLSLRLPDFYGFDAENSLAWQIFSAAAKRKTANVFAPVETPHQFFYTPDIGAVIIGLIDRPELFGVSYNVASDETISVHEFAQKVYAELGMDKPKYMAVGKTMLTLLGLFSPLLRELKEMAYLQEKPVILDGSRLRNALPALRFTSYHDGITATVARLRR